MGMDRENANERNHADSQSEAEQWFARLLDRNCPPEERAAFERWRNADPVHAAAYRDVEWLWKRGAEAVKDPAVVAAAWRALRQEPQPPARRRWLLPAMAAGLALLVAVIALPRWLSAPAEVAAVTYTTAAGQQRTVSLEDGSSILLDTDSRISVSYSSSVRRVDLLQGQAQFSVHGNHAWPFVVHAGSGTVTAVGTQFQVRLDGGSTDVALLHGKLAIATLMPDGTAQNASLIGGEGLAFDASGHITPIHPLDLQQAQGWTEGKLFVHDWRLPRLLLEMNRYSSTKLSIGDPSLQNIHVSGVFRTNDQQTFLQLLQQGWAIRAKRVSDTQVVLLR
jgi:transmembrane sensor